MSGSGNNKITSVLGASTIGTGGTAVVLQSQGASMRWVWLTVGVSLALALLAIALKLMSIAFRKKSARS